MRLESIRPRFRVSPVSSFVLGHGLGFMSFIRLDTPSAPLHKKLSIFVDKPPVILRAESVPTPGDPKTSICADPDPDLKNQNPKHVTVVCLTGGGRTLRKYAVDIIYFGIQVAVQPDQ